MDQLEKAKYTWSSAPWRELEGLLFKLQKRIFQASKNGNVERVRELQQLLLHSKSAKMLAVRRVTQDNCGRKTAGVDGVAKLTPVERMQLVESMKLEGKSHPVRRVMVPKPGKTEKRPLGIPTMRDRAKQALVLMALEPEWEARFERNSYGFRKGRSTHDAIGAIFNALSKAPAFVLDTDVQSCFDRIDHQALLNKLKTIPKLRRVIKGWLKAGVMHEGIFQPTTSGTPQGGVISPLLANIALHGLEEETKKALIADLVQHGAQKGQRLSQIAALKTLKIVRYADDFVAIHESEAIIQKAKTFMETWLAKVGLALHPDKTRIVHTMQPTNTYPPGFDFLGFTVRHFQLRGKGKKWKFLSKPSRESQQYHQEVIKRTIRKMRGSTQEEVIRTLSPIIRGWSRYFSTVVSKQIYSKLDDILWWRLKKWALRRHPRKPKRWVTQKYFKTHGKAHYRFKTDEGKFLTLHSDHKIVRHVKVKGIASPYDGQWAYWAVRLGKRPGIPTRVAWLLKVQQGKCGQCRHWFRDKDLPEVHHKDQNHKNNRHENLILLHRHCHDNVHAKRCA